MNFYCLLLAVISLFTLVQSQKKEVNNYVCTKELCENEIELTGCTALDDYCKAQNSTHNGIIFAKPTPCTCCETCLRNLVKDEYCTLGAPGTFVPISICGPGLYCTPGATKTEHATCQPMIVSADYPCSAAQRQYDLDFKAGLVGFLVQRPGCDDDGNYAPFRCIPGQTCYCVDEDNNRIFGDVEFDNHVSTRMHCTCSRMVAKLHKVIEHGYPIAHIRCDATGAFDKLQCIGDTCLCVDPKTGSPTSAAVNFTQGLLELPCFDRKIHNNESYFHDCEFEHSFTQIIYGHKEMGYDVLNFDIDYCQPDGYFGKIQETQLHRYCVNQTNDQIENFSVDINSMEAQTMTCNCARARHLLQKIPNEMEVPECCPNGNYKKYACRRGLCYCMDANGHQVGLEVPDTLISTLECYSESGC